MVGLQKMTMVAHEPKEKREQRRGDVVKHVSAVPRRVPYATGGVLWEIPSHLCRSCRATHRGSGCQWHRSLPHNSIRRRASPFSGAARRTGEQGGSGMIKARLGPFPPWGKACARVVWLARARAVRGNAPSLTRHCS